MTYPINVTTRKGFSQATFLIGFGQQQRMRRVWLLLRQPQFTRLVSVQRSVPPQPFGSQDFTHFRFLLHVTGVRLTFLIGWHEPASSTQQIVTFTMNPFRHVVVVLHPRYLQAVDEKRMKLRLNELNANFHYFSF